MNPKPEKICPEKQPQKQSLTKKILDIADFAVVPTSLIRFYQKKHPNPAPIVLYPIAFCELVRLGGYASAAWKLKDYIFPN